MGESLITFLYVGLFLLLVVGVAYGIFGPFSRAVKGKVLANRFVTSDFIWLIVLLQYPLAFLLLAKELNTVREITIAGGLLILIFVGVWLRGTAMLSYLMIYSPMRRGVFLVLLLPVALLGAVIGVPLLLTFFRHVGWSPLIAFPPSACGLLLFSLGLRRLSFWVLAGSHQQHDSMESSAS